MYYRNEKDETLVLLTLAGEQDAYEALVIRYQRSVNASAMAVTKNRFMAEDAAQDAFVTAWMKLDALKEPQKYGAWVCRIARNCAVNMMKRYRSYLPLDVVDNLSLTDDGANHPGRLYALSEERSEVNQSIAMLPEKVRTIIELHYFEGLSVAEIADRMRVSVGTVKWQLHDGRKRIRKELCAMDEKYSDTLVQRVMKKVEELKLWQVKNDKSGFEAVYREVLREVEELPESKEKQHALADVLMRGWWWIPGKMNDELFSRIVKAAEEGRNEEVMTFIVTREDSKVYGDERIAFIRDKQIPRLERAGFVKTLGREWFWLGYYLYRDNKPEEGEEAYRKAEAILSREDAYRALVPYARRMEEVLKTRYADTVSVRYMVGGSAEEYRVIDGSPRFWKENPFGEGYLASVDRESTRIFRNASACDGNFFADVPLGESLVGSDDTRLTYLSDNETVDTPSGRFDGCRLWEVRRWTDTQKIVCRTYYKEGIGIVRQDHVTDGATATHTLCAYDIKGGDGLLPLHPANKWTYTAAYSPDAISEELEFTVAYADEGKILLTYWENVERVGYDKNSWLDMVQEIANDYCCTGKEGGEYICDVTPAIARAEQLAVTPVEKAHTRAAASVARRILETDPTFNPKHTATGHWNFFCRTYLRRKGDTLHMTDYNPRWSFEWKQMGTMRGVAEDALLYNDIYMLLQDGAHCLWSDEWRIGASPIVKYTKYDGWSVKTQIVCTDGGTITTKAGRFEHCLKLELSISGLEGGWSYRSGNKVYYFAEGIGIVRTENEYAGCCRAVYELTSYEGVGEGYMPIVDGFTRRYDALNLTDGFVASAEYVYVADEDGDIIIFEDRTGIRNLPPPITQYSFIQGEMIEQELWEEKKWKEGHQRYAANNFHLLLHMLARPSRNYKDRKRSVALNGFHMDVMALFGENGEIPPAWLGLYAWRAVIRAAALFRDGETEEAYASLERAVACCERSAGFKEGDLLDLGNPYLFGGAKLVYDKAILQLPDGTQEPVIYAGEMRYDAEGMLYSLTARHGWEWFNSVRNEDRFKAYVERLRRMTNKE